MDADARLNTIGILYPGEMGSALGKLLSEGGARVIATAEGRSPRTHNLGLEAGLPLVDSIVELLDQANVVISLVPPGAALTVAAKVAALLEGASRKPLFVDANSISPVTVAQIEDVLRRASVPFVDASIFGLATQLRQRGTLYLSGSRAGELSTRFAPLLRVKVVGDSPGQASAFKMIISGIPKGLSALFIETMLFAREMHLLPAAIEGCDEIYPSIMEIMRRMLPTYPIHAGRRCEEIQEVEKTMLSNGLPPRMTHAAWEVTSDVASVPWAEGHQSPLWSMEDVLEAIYQNTLQRAAGNDKAAKESKDGELREEEKAAHDCAGR
jgi:3-hydroxyisobutyrate dehydrogenase-like beta-hydroxyacid dehydrogenase